MFLVCPPHFHSNLHICQWTYATSKDYLLLFMTVSPHIRHRDDANFLSCIPAANIFIESGADAGGVLVHCFGGRSRSAALIAAYLMSSTRRDYDSVLAILRAARPVVSINRGFEAQLRAYSQSGYDVYVAQQILLRGRVRALYSLHMDALQSRRSPSPTPETTRMPMRKRSKDFTNDAMLEREEAKGDDEDDDRYRVKKSATVISLSHLRSLVPLISAKAPNCRLTRPGSAAVRLIPPLRGVGREFCCSWCGKMLFNLANVVRLDVNAGPLLQPFSAAESKESLSEAESPSEDKADGGLGLQLSPDVSPVSEYGSRGRGWVVPSTSRHGPLRGRGFDFKEASPLTRMPTAEAKGDKGESDEEEVAPRRTPPSRLSGRFSICGPVDDDDSWSLASSTHSLKDADTGGGSPPHAIKHKASLQLQLSKATTRTNSPAVLGSQYSLDAEDSPRIPVPPHSSSSYRPQSAEKSRWLARVSLLRDGRENARVARLAQDDEDAVRLGWGAEKHIHLEYLEWMGHEALQGTKIRGPLHCAGCQNILGSYDWNPSERHTFGGRVEAPIFKLQKNVIHEAAIPMDATPASTPRVDEETDVYIPMET